MKFININKYSNIMMQDIFYILKLNNKIDYIGHKIKYKNGEVDYIEHKHGRSYLRNGRLNRSIII